MAQHKISPQDLKFQSLKIKGNTTYDIKKEGGYTLIELATVVILLAVVSSFFISKFDLNTSWGSSSAIRELSNRIEFLLQDSNSRKINYEIEFYKDGSGYRVWQIARKEINKEITVDLLKNLRSKKEQERQEEKNAAKAEKNLSEEFKKDSEIDSLPLNLQFYSEIFDDPTNSARKIAPLEYPSLVRGINFPANLKLKNMSKGQLNQNISKTNLNEENSIYITQNLSNSEYELNLDSNGENVFMQIRPFEKKVTIRYGNKNF